MTPKPLPPSGLPGATKPPFRVVTHKCRAKKRFTLVDEQSLLRLMQGVGRPLAAAPRMAAATRGTLVGIYALPTNNVLEIYELGDGRLSGYLFNNLDVWISYGQEASDG